MTQKGEGVQAAKPWSKTKRQKSGRPMNRDKKVGWCQRVECGAADLRKEHERLLIVWTVTVRNIFLPGLVVPSQAPPERHIQPRDCAPGSV